jgi:hypothetical protein
MRTKIDQEYGDEETSSYFRLYDAETFSRKSQEPSTCDDSRLNSSGISLAASSEIALDKGEKPTSLEMVQFDEGGVQYFALGTTFENRPDDAGASSSGYLRIINVKVDEVSGRPPSSEIVASRQMNGTVYDIKVIWGALAVAVDHRVSYNDC